MRQRSIIHVLAATALAAATVGASAPAAHAFAYGCDSWAAFKAIPRGVLCHKIWGDGLRIESQDIEVFSPNLCNTRVELVYRDTNGAEYRRDAPYAQSACDGVSVPTVNRAFTARPGTACVELFSNGEHLVTQCHSITD